MSLPGPVQESDRSTTHHDARKTDLPRMGQRLFTDIRRSHKGTLVVDLKPDTLNGGDYVPMSSEEKVEAEKEEEEEDPDLLACRPCGLVFPHAWGLKDHQI